MSICPRSTKIVVLFLSLFRINRLLCQITLFTLTDLLMDKLCPSSFGSTLFNGFDLFIEWRFVNDASSNSSQSKFLWISYQWCCFDGKRAFQRWIINHSRCSTCSTCFKAVAVAATDRVPLWHHNQCSRPLLQSPQTSFSCM